MKYLLLSFLISMNVYSQESEKCQLHLDTVDREDLGMIGIHKHEGFMNLLEEKGYEVIPVLLSISKTPPSKNQISLKYFNQFNCRNEAKSVSISFGSSSWKSKNEKWFCPIPFHQFSLEAQSDSGSFKTNYKFEDYIQGIDLKKRFQTQEDAQSQILMIFNKLIPTCSELRTKLPDAGKKAIVEKEASVKSEEEIITEELKLETAEEIQEES